MKAKSLRRTRVEFLAEALAKSERRRLLLGRIVALCLIGNLVAWAAFISMVTQ